ncbi:nitroreductase family protein [candidate division WOR-3 bacterium]|nr:nitroreductase family protein [candidate division WOR-3 bacterium]
MDQRLMTIFRRRSVRSFISAPVGRDDVAALFQAAMSAPSASNARPGHFVAVTEPERLKRLAEIHPYGKMLGHAGLAIAICGDKQVSPDFWVQDCSASTENILIAAPLLGLGAVWLGVHPRAQREADIKQFLGIPERMGLLCLIAVGRPAHEPSARTQYDPERIHRERW